MKRIRVGINLVLISILCASVFTQAQQTVATNTNVAVPPLVNFTSTLTDVNGKPLTGMVGVTFFLYKDSQQGAPLWMETQNVQPDENGHYSVMLGATISTGLPANLFSSGEAHWLGVQVQGEAERPRVMLLSVPYAMKAGDAQTVGGLPASAFVMAQPGASTSSPASSQSARPGHPKPPLGGSGVQNYIPLWTDNSGDLGDSMLFQFGTSAVGVGTVTPVATLDVNGSMRAKGNGNNAVIGDPGCGFGYAGIGITTGSLSNCTNYALIGGPSGGTYINSNGTGTIHFRNNNTELATIDNKGNLTVIGQNGGGSLTVDGTLGVNGGMSVFGPQFAFDGETVDATNNSQALNVLQGGTGNGMVGATQGSSASGVYGTNSNTTSFNGIGVEGQASHGTGVFGQVSSLSGTCQTIWGGCSGRGIWGDGGTIGWPGVGGSADDNDAATFYNNSKDASTIFTLNLSGGPTAPVLQTQGASGDGCTIDSSGSVGCSGTLTSIVSAASGERNVLLYATESTESWFEDAGSGQLSNGSARINLDPTFAQTVNTGIEYHVFLTPNDDCKGLYVSQKTATSFQVHELGGGRSNVAFDYRLMAKRKGHENLRLTDVTDVVKQRDLRRQHTLQHRADSGTGPVNPGATVPSANNSDLTQASR